MGRANLLGRADPLRGDFDDLLQALERQRQVGAALGSGNGVDLVDDHPADTGQRLAGLGGEQQEQRFRGGDEDVGWVAQHLSAFFRRRVSGPEEGVECRERRAAKTGGGVANSCQGSPEVPVDVVGQRLEGRHVQDPASLLAVGNCLVEETVEDPEKCCQRLSGPGRGVDEGVVAARDCLPSRLLSGGRLGKRGREPGSGGRAETLERIHPTRVRDKWDKTRGG